MTADDLHALFEKSPSLTAAELHRVEVESRENPDVARAMWAIRVGLARHDETAAMVLGLAIAPLMVDLLTERIQNDDAFALNASALLFAMMRRVETFDPPTCAKVA